MSAYISSGTRPKRSSVIALLVAAAVLYLAQEVLIPLAVALLLAFLLVDLDRDPFLGNERGEKMRRVIWSLWPTDNLPVKQPGEDIGCQVCLTSGRHGRCIDEALFRPGGGRLPCRGNLCSVFRHRLQ